MEVDCIQSNRIIKNPASDILFRNEDILPSIVRILENIRIVQLKIK